MAITPTTAAVIPVRAAVRCWLCPQPFHVRGAEQTNRKQGTKVTQRDQQAGQHRGGPGVEGAGVVVGADEGDELRPP